MELTQPAEVSWKPQPIPLEIVHEDNALLVINKPPGMVVHPGAGNFENTLLNAVMHHAPTLETVPRAGIVHRLDKDTSGLLVVAKTDTVRLRLVRELQARRIRREYLALVSGVVRAGGSIAAPIGRHPVHRTRMSVRQRGRKATSHYSVKAVLPESHPVGGGAARVRANPPDPRAHGPHRTPRGRRPGIRRTRRRRHQGSRAGADGVDARLPAAGPSRGTARTEPPGNGRASGMDRAHARGHRGRSWKRWRRTRAGDAGVFPFLRGSVVESWQFGQAAHSPTAAKGVGK